MSSLTSKSTLCTLLLGLLATYNGVNAAGESVSKLTTKEFDSFVGSADLSLIEVSVTYPMYGQRVAGTRLCSSSLNCCCSYFLTIP